MRAKEWPWQCLWAGKERSWVEEERVNSRFHRDPAAIGEEVEEEEEEEDDDEEEENREVEVPHPLPPSLPPSPPPSSPSPPFPVGPINCRYREGNPRTRAPMASTLEAVSW